MRYYLPIIALLLLGAPARAADGYTIDQSFEPEIWGEWSIALLGPVGQEFVPDRSALDVVELWVSHGTAGSEPPTEVFARIRAGGVDGAVLGASAPVVVVDDHFAPVRFDFAAPVATTPGETYVIELAVGAGGGNPMVCGANYIDYPRGRAILGGNPSAGDLWFRTGVTANVPADAPAWGAVKRLYDNHGRSLPD